MRFFDFKPEPNSTADQTAAASMLWGGISFCFVSLLAYSIWALRLVGGTGPMYAAITIVYLGLSGVALSRLVRAPRAVLRFSIFFALAFLVYAVVWCLFWFGLHGKHFADLWGSIVGLAVMTWLFRRVFGNRDDFLPIFAVLFLCHTIGYYLGGVFHAMASGSAGALLWGGFHGLGFGAGLGYVLWMCQRR